MPVRGTEAWFREEGRKGALKILICGPCCVLCSWLALFFAVTPLISLHFIYIPALNKTLESPITNSLFFSLKLENNNEIAGVHYDPINVTFYDGPNRDHSIANFTVPQFYQGCGKTTAIKGATVKISGLDREAAVHEIEANGSAAFRVDVATSVRYKAWLFRWITKRHNVKVGGDVHLNDQGTFADYKKDLVLLKSGAAGSFRSSFVYGHLVVVSMCLLTLVSAWY